MAWVQAGPEVNESVRRVLLPADATHLSLGHFLELGLGLEHCQVPPPPGVTLFLYAPPRTILKEPRNSW